MGRTETRGADVIIRPNRDPTESTLFIPSVTERIQRAGSLVQWSAYFLVPDVSVEMLVVRPSDSHSSTEAFTLLGRTKVTCTYRRRFNEIRVARCHKIERLSSGTDEPWATWRSLNRLRVQKGRCRAMTKMWMLSHTDVCDCGERQTMSHLMACGDAPQLHVDRPGYTNSCRCQLCQPLGGIYPTINVEDSMMMSRLFTLQHSGCVVEQCLVAKLMLMR